MKLTNALPWLLALSALGACTVTTNSKPSDDAEDASNGGAKASSSSSGGSDDRGIDSSSSLGAKSGLGGAGNATSTSPGTQWGTGLGGGGGNGTKIAAAGSTAKTVSCVINKTDVSASTAWEPSPDCPEGFLVNHNVEITGAGTRLDIKPGVTLKFAPNSGIFVRTGASIVAVGTETAPITFTAQIKEAGSWSGIDIQSSATANEIGYAIIEYTGEEKNMSAALVLAIDTQYATLKLHNTQIRDNKLFGMTIYSGTSLTQFDDNTVTRNAKGAIRVEAPNVHQLAGKNNSLVANGAGNSVRIESSNKLHLLSDVTWPNLAPAVYRVSSVDDTGSWIYVNKHLTLQPGTVFEMLGGAGFDITGPDSGLSATGTPDAPIVFRGIDGAGWAGIGFCETPWAKNGLEEVQIFNAAGPPPQVAYCGNLGAPNVQQPAMVVGHNYTENASKLRVKNLKVSGPNNAPADIMLRSPSTLTEEGTNTGSGTNGELFVQKVQ
jgi:hypothetical protein